MFNTRPVLVVCIPRHESHQIFLNPCHHISHMIFRMELVGTFPSCGKSAVSIGSTNWSSLFTAKCHRCSKRVSKSQFFWIIVSTRTFLCLTDSLATSSEDLCSIILPPPFGVYEIDHSGYRVVAHHLCRHIILQEAMSWLSTLGGGFSSLGDKFEDAAEIAGEISLRQMYLALSMKIPVFQARCRLFFAQSLMQRGRLKAAELIIRDVYSFSKSASAHDNPPEIHLSLMCHGLWKRLSHLWSLRRTSKQLTQRLRLHLHTDEIGALPCSKQPLGTLCDFTGTDNRRLFPDITAVLKIM
ncbi:Uncharacterized protein ECG_01556 [Echinococcus granulosus]|uniref:Expressed conserved protein n=1 Tax=Echinococcus granulosus TaxID=6210 RepID=A0A068WAR8_ECHGR|nr:Uncharacterized protein ECG_01556 [Echinococcus granulosus]CDS15515.1 expressed conserved protein [Echinococcus granulosus]